MYEQSKLLVWELSRGSDSPKNASIGALRLALMVKALSTLKWLVDISTIICTYRDSLTIRLLWC